MICLTEDKIYVAQQMIKNELYSIASSADFIQRLSFNWHSVEGNKVIQILLMTTW